MGAGATEGSEGTGDLSASLDTDDPAERSDDAFLRAVAKAPVVAPPSPSVSEPPARVGSFVILERLGRGGMGVVYRARDEKLRRVVALKLLVDDFASDPQRRRRFFREAHLAAAINHPNVAMVHEVGEADGRIYIVMELVEGTTLRRRIDDGGLTNADALRIVRDVAKAMTFAHESGIAHRDLKPDNVMIASDGTVKVLDFGLAKPMHVDADAVGSITWTKEGSIVGTPGYMSPEQATGRAVDVRTDVFSMGVILYEMLTGKRPFVGERSMDVVIATSRDPHRRASELQPTIGPELDRVIDRCLEKQPEARYPTARELSDALQPEALASVASHPPAAIHPPAASAATKGRSVGARAGAALAGVGLLLVGGIGWSFARSSTSRAREADAAFASVVIASSVIAEPAPPPTSPTSAAAPAGSVRAARALVPAGRSATATTARSVASAPRIPRDAGQALAEASAPAPARPPLPRDLAKGPKD